MNSLLGRLTLVALFLLIVAAVSVACGREAGAPLPVGTSGASAAVAAPERAGDSASPKGIISGSAATPSRVESGGMSGFNRSPLPQTTPTEGGLTVSAMGSVTLAADEAYVVIILEQRYGSFGPEQMTADDRKEIIEELAELGVSEEAVEFENLGRYGQSSISVEVELSEIAELGERILDAVEAVVRRSEAHGVRYSLSAENCDRALSMARREAVPSAEKAADDWAQALGLERGAVIGAAESTPGSFYGYGPLSVGRNAGDAACNGVAADPYFGPAPFDTEAEVEVSVGLLLTYGIR